MYANAVGQVLKKHKHAETHNPNKKDKSKGVGESKSEAFLHGFRKRRHQREAKRVWSSQY